MGDGYYKLSGGLIIQWGYISQPSAGVVEIPFPLPFPNRPLSITATPILLNPAGNDTVSIRSISNTVFTINRMAQGAAAWSAYYIAIGN
ncbi:gp53-like domain-containing protein [Pectobacterium parmentieri]|uniref:gp53-like domain-containing protein n=1 Tax=Pectobacterium parmentieri TaxID=1905730 RepID=UPI003B2155A4